MLAKLRARLLSWYQKEQRKLPWRKSGDPYRVWVSEIMLQQTRVEAVIPYYERFLQRFPTILALADAADAEVLSAWSGLGYYRRARHLRQAAQQIRDDHGGVFPDDPKVVRQLPGIGRYTAGAILSIAFGKCEPAVDGNVIRVLTRWFRLKGDPTRNPLAARLWQTAAELARGTQPGDVNQALMELGATICLPNSKPRCLFCPVAAFCEARQQGDIARFPETPAKPEPPLEHWAVGFAERRARYLARRREDETLMEGLWEFPTVQLSRPASSEADAKGQLQRFLGSLGVVARVGPKLFVHRQGISGRRVVQRVHAVHVESSSRQTRWLLARELQERGTTTATHKIRSRVEAGKQ